MNEYGIENLKEVIIAAVKGAVYGIQLARGKPFSFADVTAIIPSIIAAAEDIDQVDEEAKDISSAEFQELAEAALVELQPLGIIDPEIAKFFVAAGTNYTEGTINLIAGIRALKEAQGDDE